MSNSANDSQVVLVTPRLRVEHALQVVGTDAARSFRVVDIEIDCGAPRWSAAEYKTNYEDTLNARRFCEMFLYVVSTFILDRRNVRSDTDVGACARRGTLLRKWWTSTLKDNFSIDMTIVHQARGVDYLQSLLSLTWNVNVASQYRGLDLCCFEDPIDGLFLVMDADAWWLELELEGRQHHHARRLRFVQWNCLEMFFVPLNTRNDFYITVPNGLDCK